MVDALQKMGDRASVTLDHRACPSVTPTAFRARACSIGIEQHGGLNAPSLVVADGCEQPARRIGTLSGAYDCCLNLTDSIIYRLRS